MGASLGVSTAEAATLEQISINGGAFTLSVNGQVRPRVSQLPNGAGYMLELPDTALAPGLSAVDIANNLAASNPLITRVRLSTYREAGHPAAVRLWLEGQFDEPMPVQGSHGWQVALTRGAAQQQGAWQPASYAPPVAQPTYTPMYTPPAYTPPTYQPAPAKTYAPVDTKGLSAQLDTINRLQAENSRLNSKVLQLGEQNGRLQAEVTGLQARLNTTTNQIDAVAAKARAEAQNQAETEVESLRRQLAEAKNQLVASVNIINQQNADLVQLREQVTRIQGGLSASAVEQLTVLNQKLEEKDAEIRRLLSQQSQPASASSTSDGGMHPASFASAARPAITGGRPDALDEAQKAFEENDYVHVIDMLKGKASDKKLLSLLATSYKKLKRYSDAEKVLKQALSGSPNDAELLFNLGNLYQAQNSYKDAQRQYEAALRAQPDFAEAHYNLGLVLVKQGEKKRAAEALNTYLKLNPSAGNREQVAAYIERLEKG